jgi:hypothetical protein
MGRLGSKTRGSTQKDAAMQDLPLPHIPAAGTFSAPLEIYAVMRKEASKKK